MINIKDYTDEKGRFDGRYLLIRPLSTDGATADVWLSLDLNTVALTDSDKIEHIAELSDEEIEKIGLIVAIKIYRPQNALDVEGEQRFRDEYMIVYNCHHANLVHPTNFSICKDTPYLVLPYCKQGSSELLIGKKLDNDTVWKYIQDVASGLAYLHALDPPIVHQDVKPANILLDDTGNYALTDFGISSQRGGVHGYYNDDENHGTMAYMAPERFQKDAVPMAQSDIWGFGATLCEILTGKVPFGEGGGNSQAGARLPMPTIPGIHADLQRLIHACLAQEPGNRPTAQQIAEAARAKQFPIKSKKILWTVLTVLAALLICGATYYVAHQPHEVIVSSQTPSVPIEEQYDHALLLIDNNRDMTNPKDSLKQGLKQMLFLSDQKYVPAMFKIESILSSADEQLRNDLLSLMGSHQRKKGFNRYNSLSFSLLTQIIVKKDSAFSNINATAAYRLGCYNLDSKSYLKTNLNEANKLFSISEHWIAVANDTLVPKDKRDITINPNLINDIKINKERINNRSTKK